MVSTPAHFSFDCIIPLLVIVVVGSIVNAWSGLAFDFDISALSHPDSDFDASSHAEGFGVKNMGIMKGSGYAYTSMLCLAYLNSAGGVLLLQKQKDFNAPYPATYAARFSC